MKENTFDKNSKKLKGEKVKMKVYWNDLDPREVEDLIATRHAARARYLSRRKQRQDERKRWRRRKGLPPLEPTPQIHIPVGLAPDEAIRYRKFMENKNHSQREKTGKELAAIKHHKNVLNAAKKKGNESDAFLTSLPSVCKSKKSNKRRVSIFQGDKKTDKDDLEKEVKEKKETLHIWEFLDDVLKDNQHKKSKVLFRNCQKHKNVTAEQIIRNTTDAVSANKRVANTTSVLNGRQSSHTVQQSNELTNKDQKKRKNGRKRKKEKARRAHEKLGAKPIVNISSHRQPPIEKPSITNSVKDPPMAEITKTLEISDGKSRSFAEKLESFSDVSLAPISIVVKASSLRPSALLHSHGEQYHEGHVFPRMFTIDITDRVKDTVKMFR